MNDFIKNVKIIRFAVEKLIQKKNVILVMHFYNDISSEQALKGLNKQSCKEKEIKENVMRLIYMMTFIILKEFKHSLKKTRDNIILFMKTNCKIIIII